MTSVSGAVVWSAKYESFGKAEVEVETVENNLRFAGQYLDHESGLHYNWFRYYDTGIRSYLTKDLVDVSTLIILTQVSLSSAYKINPFMPKSKATKVDGFAKLLVRLQIDPKQQNDYAYSLNNPLLYIDPSGEIGIPGMGIGVISGAWGGFVTGGWKGAVLGGLIGGAVGFFNPGGSMTAAGMATQALIAGGINATSQHASGHWFSDGCYEFSYSAMLGSMIGGAFQPIVAALSADVFGLSFFGRVMGELIAVTTTAYYELAVPLLAEYYMY